MGLFQHLRRFFPFLKNDDKQAKCDTVQFDLTLHTLEHLITKYLRPFLLENKWEGDGFRFYKETRNETINLLEVVPESKCPEFSIALGIHFTFINYEFSERIEDYSYAGVDIRGGLPYEDSSEISINCPTTEKQAIETFTFLKDQILKAESSFFQKFGNWKEYYLRFTPDSIDLREKELERITDSRFTLLCARIFEHSNLYNRSKEMAEFGLTTIKFPTGNGSALHPEFMKIINESKKH